jgi:hypothetical protein
VAMIANNDLVDTVGDDNSSYGLWSSMSPRATSFALSLLNHPSGCVFLFKNMDDLAVWRSPSECNASHFLSTYI